MPKSVNAALSGGSHKFATAKLQKIFSNWSDNGDQTHTVFRPVGPTTFAANFVTDHAIPISVGANIPGAIISADGVNYPAPQVFQWFTGSVHSLGITAPGAPVGSRYAFTNWSCVTGIAKT